jgi:hypothetical protein
MIDYAEELVSALGAILPTTHELALTSQNKVPCISWQERNNSSYALGNTREYSNLSYTIKVWGTDLEEIQNYAMQIDSTMRTLGFKRVSAGELYDVNSTMIQKILTYEALTLEVY